MWTSQCTYLLNVSSDVGACYKTFFVNFFLSLQRLNDRFGRDSDWLCGTRRGNILQSSEIFESSVVIYGFFLWKMHLAQFYKFSWRNISKWSQKVVIYSSATYTLTKFYDFSLGCWQFKNSINFLVYYFSSLTRHKNAIISIE